MAMRNFVLRVATDPAACSSTPTESLWAVQTRDRAWYGVKPHDDGTGRLLLTS